MTHPHLVLDNSPLFGQPNADRGLRYILSSCPPDVWRQRQEARNPAGRREQIGHLNLTRQTNRGMALVLAIGRR